MAGMALPELHRGFVRHMVSSAAVVQSFQQKRTGPVDATADLLSRMGGRTVYMYAIPAVLWLLNASCARKLIAAWAVGFYLSSCMRDMLCVPRLDQVVDGAAVRGGDASEYGFPCTKSYSATLFPILFSYLTWKQDEFHMGLHILLCFFWVPSLLASRVYTGVASLASVFGGSIIAMATTALWTQYGDAVDTMLVRHALLFAVAQPVVVSIALLAYPIPWRHTPTFQTAASVLALASGFLFGCSFAVSGYLPEFLSELPPPVHLHTGLMPILIVATSRFIIGSSISYLVKSITDRAVKQMGLSLSWFVPRLLPTFAPLLPCMYGHDDLAFPLLSILTERPPTLKVRLEGGVGDAHGFSPFPGQTTPTPAPPESNGKFRKRKPSRGTDPLQGVPLPSTPQVPSTKEFVLPVVHHGSPATWYGIPLATAFTRMLKVASSSSGLLLGPWSVLHAGKGEDIPPPPCDVEVLPAEGVNAGVLACVPLFAAEHKKCARVLPPLLLSHFAAGIASALLAPSFMYNFTV